MKLFKVFNGYYGSAALSVLVLTEDRAKALKLARPAFRNSAIHERLNSIELQTELVFEDCNQSQCSILMEFR